MRKSRHTKPGTLTRVAAMLVVVAVSSGAAQPVTNLVPEPRHSDVATHLAEKLPSLHVTDQPLDDTISERALDIYLKKLDPQRLYFLASDVEAFRKRKTELDDDLVKGKVQFGFDIFNRFAERARDRSAYVTNLLDKGFDLNLDETYHWERKYEPWPADTKEWDDLWRRRVKNQYVRRVLVAEQKADEDSEAEAKDKEDVDPAAAILKMYNRYLELINQTDAESVLQRYLSSFTLAYDPHCHYMSPAATENFAIDMKLSLVGIGAVLNSEDGTTVIKRIVPGGPASRDKRDIRLEPGDKIIAVGQDKEPAEDVMDWPLNKVVKLIRGEKGTRVVLTVIPASDPSGATTKKVDLIRDEVNLEDRGAKQSTRPHKTPDGEDIKLGIIDLPAFYGDMQAAMERKEHYRSSTRDVAKILLDMERDGVDGVLLDLRGNGGGSLHEAVQMTGLFVEWGPVVLIGGKGGKGRVLADTDPSLAYAGPLVVLVSRHSASASEILAGALQDYGRALIVGDSKTLGKGSVQSIVKLGDDDRLGTLRGTTALYYRITGSSTQLKGVTSDMVIPSQFETMEIGEDYLDHALEWRMVRQMPYRPFCDLVPLVPDMIEGSLERMSKDKDFKIYTNLLARVDSISDIEELPLNIEERRKVIEERRKLREMQDELLQKDESEETPARDLVLEEGLNILADLVFLHPPTDVREKALKTLPRIITIQDIPDAIREEAKSLVEQLGHKRFEKRKAARDRLEEIGRIAAPVLDEHREAKDPEVRRIILELLGE